MNPDYIAVGYNNNNLIIYPLINGDIIRSANTGDFPIDGKYSVLFENNDNGKKPQLISNVSRLELITKLIGLNNLKNFGLFIKQEK